MPIEWSRFFFTKEAVILSEAKDLRLFFAGLIFKGAGL
jgi:hypothetical protein